MGKSRMMGAGLGSSSLYKSNPNINTSGGCKKQGLAYEIGVGPVNNDSIRSRAQGNNRNTVFYMNQVGGISPSLRNIVIGGVHHKSFMQAELSDFQSASNQTLMLWLKELSLIQRLRRFISKKYKGSFDHDTFKAFIIKYLPRLKLIFSSIAGSIQNVEETMDPSMTLTYGGVTWNAYSQCGGSRIYLSTTNDVSTTMNAKTTTYINIDCTKNVTISTDVNISTLKAGTIFTFYLVPMIKGTDSSVDSNGNLIRYNGLDTNSTNIPINQNLSDGLTSLNGTYDAEWGLGYRDAQSVATTINGFTTSGPCIEIDLFEMSLCNVQTTIHAYIDENGSKIIDKKGTYQNSWGNKGCYNASGNYIQSDELFNKDAENPPFGPGTSFLINTLETFNVSSTIVVSGTTLTLTTIITQGANSITLQPDIPSWIYFSDSGSDLEANLSQMQLVSALWVPSSTSGETTWLDGIDWINPSDPDYDANKPYYIKSYAQYQTVGGGPIPQVNQLTKVLTNPSVTSPISYYYADHMGSSNYPTDPTDPDPSLTYGPIFARFNNVNINTEESIVYKNTCWSLDFYFRGITPDDGSLNFWHGFYGQTYSMAYDSLNNNMSDALTSTLTIPSNYYNTISGVPNSSQIPNGLYYEGNVDQLNYFAELTKLGITDAAQLRNAYHDYNLYGYALLDQDSNYQPIVPTTTAEMVTQIKQFNTYGVQYLSTPDLITFSS